MVVHAVSVKPNFHLFREPVDPGYGDGSNDASNYNKKANNSRSKDVHDQRTGQSFTTYSSSSVTSSSSEYHHPATSSTTSTIHQPQDCISPLLPLPSPVNSVDYSPYTTPSKLTSPMLKRLEELSPGNHHLPTPLEVSSSSTVEDKRKKSVEERGSHFCILI